MTEHAPGHGRTCRTGGVTAQQPRPSGPRRAARRGVTGRSRRRRWCSGSPRPGRGVPGTRPRRRPGPSAASCRPGPQRTWIRRSRPRAATPPDPCRSCSCWRPRRPRSACPGCSGHSRTPHAAFFHADGTSFWSTSRGSSGFAFTLRRASAGSRFTASGTRRPPETAPSADDSPSRAGTGTAAACCTGRPARGAPAPPPRCPRAAAARPAARHCGLDLGARDGLLLQGPEHRRRVQIGARLGDQIPLHRLAGRGAEDRRGVGAPRAAAASASSESAVRVAA